ncbi:hypothetical protein K523DRAFT_94444 [Schizophyllum commune Tattone D]|nr:hypothetical protein K523DRAFT_94444 [Schizophyllum commune Tattone D]
MGPCRAFNARSWACGTRLAYFGVGPIRVHGIISASIAVRCAWIALPSVDGLCPMTLCRHQSAAKIGRPRVDRRLLRLSWVRTAVLCQARMYILRQYASRSGSYTYGAGVGSQYAVCDPLFFAQLAFRANGLNRDSSGMRVKMKEDFSRSSSSSMCHTVSTSKAPL